MLRLAQSLLGNWDLLARPLGSLLPVRTFICEDGRIWESAGGKKVWGAALLLRGPEAESQEKSHREV